MHQINFIALRRKTSFCLSNFALRNCMEFVAQLAEYRFVDPDVAGWFSALLLLARHSSSKLGSALASFVVPSPVKLPLKVVPGIGGVSRPGC